jgi:hypothetical protein
MHPHDHPISPCSGAGAAAGALLAAALLACGPAADGTDAGEAAGEGRPDAAARPTPPDTAGDGPAGRREGPAYGIRLTTDRAVYSPGDTIRMRLEVFRRGGEALTLSFPTAQRHDFVLRGPDASGPGGEVWRWSDDRFFAQSTATVNLDADRPAITAAAARPAPATPGLYRLEGRLTASKWPVSAVVPVTVVP